MESQHLGYSVRYISSIPYRSTAYIYFIFRRLHIDLTILRTVFQEQKRPSHPATLTISDIPPGSETADLPQVPASAAKTKKQHTLLIIEDHLEIRLYLKLIFSNEYNLLMAENGEEHVKEYPT